MSLSGAYARVSGGRLYYEVAGGPGDPPVVLIHSGFLDRRMWDDQFALLPTKGFRVIRYDMRGSGKSDRPTGKYDDARDLSELLDYIGVESASVVGLSNGGSVAIDFALSYPDRFTSLVLVAPTVEGYEYGSPQEEKMDHAKDKEWDRWEEAMKQGRVGEAIDIHLSIMGPALGRARPKIAAIAWDNYDVFKDPFSDLREVRDPPAFKRLKEIRAPTLLIWGDNDIPGQITLAERVHQRIPKSSRLLIRGADHFVNVSQPSAFDEAVTSFLRCPIRGGG